MMFKQTICLLIVLTILSATLVNAAIVNVPSAFNNAVVTGAPGVKKPSGNGKKGEWRRRKFPKPVEKKNEDAKMDDDDDMGMDKRSYYGDYYYYYYCG
uniref:Uncharacterized protein n=1 Tax=Panagrolaimus superbus TaxID=310955 RepID=A0A914XZ05_9BILA